MTTLLITGGAGFTESAGIKLLMANTDWLTLNVDKLTYAANLIALKGSEQSNRYQLAQVDICDRTSIEQLFYQHEPEMVMHLAAKNNVDRTIIHASHKVAPSKADILTTTLDKG